MVNSHVIVGSGDHKVIALHGWFGSASAWGLFPEFVDGSRFTYAFMDYRGYGGSRDLTGDYTMEEIVADTVALADQLGWQQFSLVGHSMGGVAIQRALVDAPNRVRRLVGINPVPASPFPWDEQGWALFAGAADSRENRYAIIDYTTGNRLTPTFINSVVDHSLTQSNRDAFAAYLEPWGKANFADLIKGNETPIKVFVGAHDPALSADLMRQTFMEYYPNAELQVSEDGGHYPMFEAPVLLVTSVEEFLSR